ncbi:MAG: putative porin, partial [Steroidobacteraceae bacterium]
MRNTALASAIAAALLLAATDASAAQTTGTASKADVQALQAQMDALIERLNKLEGTNAQLQTDNAELKALAERREAEIDYLKVQTRDLREESAVAANDIAKVKGADWATRIKGRGDFRYRHETIKSERDASGETEDAADRNRERIRARLGFDANITDNVKATLLLATGGDDPRSSNQTLGSSGTRKTIGLDMGYVDWKFMQGANLLLGKMPTPLFRPGQSLFYDADYNPEGVAVKFERGMFFGTGYGWFLSENYNSDPARNNVDVSVFGIQGGVKFPLLSGDSVLAVNYYECVHCEGQSPLYAKSGNGNTTYVSGTTNLLEYGYEIVELGGQMGLTVRNLPLTLWAQYSQNMASAVENDSAYAFGAMLGKASNARTW